MGGNAIAMSRMLKNENISYEQMSKMPKLKIDKLKEKYQTTRLSVKQYYPLSDTIISLLKTKISDRIYLVKSYKEKSSFGDMDILVSNKNINLEDLRIIVEDLFRPSVVVSNTNILSFDIDNFQIDLILVDDSEFDLMLHYLNYNEIGHIMGRIYSQLGLIYGMDGLKFKYKSLDDKNQYRTLGEFYISKSSKDIFEFIGLDYSRYKKGFNNLQEIYEYIATSSYFNKDIFIKELSKMKKDEDTRSSYYNFLKFCKYTGISSKHSEHTDKTKYYSVIKKYFKDCDFDSQLEKLVEKARRKRIISRKFNGKLITEKYPDLKGAKLGEKILKFKNSKTDFDKYIYDTPETQIWSDFNSIIN